MKTWVKDNQGNCHELRHEDELLRCEQCEEIFRTSELHNGHSCPQCLNDHRFFPVEERDERIETIEVPEKGDWIYLPTSLYLSHGADDFCGGRALVIEVRRGVSAGRYTPFVICAERRGSQYNWLVLMEEQDELRERYGESEAHADPDLRPEFNRWD
jgi:hypothetical protein